MGEIHIFHDPEATPAGVAGGRNRQRRRRRDRHGDLHRSARRAAGEAVCGAASEPEPASPGLGEGSKCDSNTLCRDRIRARHRRRLSSRHPVQTRHLASRCPRRSDVPDVSCATDARRDGRHRGDPRDSSLPLAAPNPGPPFFGGSWTQIGAACWIRGHADLPRTAAPVSPRTGPS